MKAVSTSRASEATKMMSFLRGGLGSAMAFLAIAIGGLGLSGCRMDDYLMDDQMALLHDDPQTRHAITFDRTSETMIIEAPARGHRLSHDQISYIHGFVRHYKREATGVLVVSAPRHLGARHRVKPILRRVQDILDVNGIDAARVVAKRFHADGAWPSVRLAYQRPVIIAPQCGDWSEDVAVNRERIHYPNYGCASQRNLAAAVANARDLLRPRDVTPRSSERRSADWKSYIDPEAGNKGGQGGGSEAAAATQGK